MSKRERYGALDGLRAYAAICILIMHVLANGNYVLSGFVVERIIPKWMLFVFLFMMVSAFSLCCGYFEEFLNRQIDYRQFYKKRFLKIWPLFALLCLCELIISPSRGALYESLANLTMCFAFLPNHNISVIGVGWFLGVLVIFYMIFPFFCSLMSNKKSAWGTFAVACILHMLCRIYFFDEGHVLPGFDEKQNFAYCAMYFVAGGLLYLYREKLSEISERYRWIVLIACALVTFLMIMIGANTILVVLVFSLYIMYAIGNQGGVLENRFTRFISGISLEIYLCHMSVFRVLEKLKLTQLFGNNSWSFLTMVIVTFGGTVAFAVLIKKMFDRAAKLIKPDKH